MAAAKAPATVNVAVYCGASLGHDPAHAQAADELAAALARRHVGLVFGGGQVGLMGRVADAMLSRGRPVVGVIPRSLHDRELAHRSLTELIVVDSMHERKQTMFDRADAFVALSGGLGTLDELFEVWTWSQLGMHGKPLALLNTKGYYDDLLRFVDRAVESGFVQAAQRGALIVESSAEVLVTRLLRFQHRDMSEDKSER